MAFLKLSMKVQGRGGGKQESHFTVTLPDSPPLVCRSDHLFCCIHSQGQDPRTQPRAPNVLVQPTALAGCSLGVLHIGMPLAGVEVGAFDIPGYHST